MQLAGNVKVKEVCLGRAKMCFIDLLLECSIGELYNFASIWVIRELFLGGIRRENAVQMHSTELHAFLRMIG